MAQTRAYKKTMNFVYGMGAAVVIIGALFKITHYSIGFLTGTVMLSIGLITEALVFAISAFDTPEDDLDWARVYPELGGGKSKDKSDVKGILSQKLDDMLEEAKLDVGLMQSLGEGIKNFSGAAENLAPAVDSIAATNRYSEQLSLAAAQMESLNSLYQLQVESASRQAEINTESIENASKLKEQMESLATNLSSLNGVYGGMLSAMNKN